MLTSLKPWKSRMRLEQQYQQDIIRQIYEMNTVLLLFFILLIREKSAGK